MENFYNKLKQFLPEEPILIGRDKNFKSAVFAPFVEINGTEQLLFEKRAKGIRQAGEICFPGGMMDLDCGENSRDTAIRETVEELGISKNKIEVDAHLGYLVANMGATLDVFIGKIKISGLDELEPNKDEVESLHLIPFSFFIENKPERYLLQTEIRSVYYNEKGEEEILFPAKELGLPEKYHTCWPVRKTAVYAYKYNDIVIWGLTAEIVREIAKVYIKGSAL